MSVYRYTIVVLLLFATPATAEWARVETPNFVVFGEVGGKRTREVAAEFERFREAIARVLPGAMTTSAVPAMVVVFDSQKSFGPYLPRFNGKPVKLGGFFRGSETSNTIAMSLDDRDQALRIIFHEYTHLITANASRALPAWVSEGLAEFYSTFAVASDGKGGVLGRVIPAHYQLLGTNALLPIEQLLTVDHASPLYNEGQRRSIFYAQSWAIVHMFIAGEPSRSTELSDYLRLTAGGTASTEAWRRTFGDLDVNKELKRYLSRATVRNFAYKFDDSIQTYEPLVSTPRMSDVDAALGSLLRYSAPDEAEPRLRRAVSVSPPSALARALLGAVLVRQTQRDEGVRLLLDAASDPGDWLAQYYVAAGLREMLRGRDRDPKLLAAARAAIDAVLKARPELAHGLFLKAELVGGTEGAALASHARGLAPGREDYVFLEAKLRAEAGEFGAARSLLSALLTPRFPPQVRDVARLYMGDIVRLEQMRTRQSQKEPSASTDPVASSSSRPTAAADAAAVFRELRSGEERTEGRLERLECSAKGAVTLVVRVDGSVKRFTAPAFGDIEFITYREDLSGSINCGERKPPDPVYVTWVKTGTSGDSNGRPVAVEFLPPRR